MSWASSQDKQNKGKELQIFPEQNSTRPWQKLDIDLEGPNPEARTGRYKYIIKMKDVFTRYAAESHLETKKQ